MDSKPLHRVSRSGESWSGVFGVSKSPSGEQVVSVKPEVHRRALAAAAAAAASKPAEPIEK